MKIKTILIDDEMDCRNILAEKIKRYCPEIELLAQCKNVDEGLKALNDLNPDLVFLDIEMPGKSGFNFIEEAGSKKFGVIFTTAYDHYAIRAIRMSALDYLLKPIDVSELQKAIQNFKRIFNSESSNSDILELLKSQLKSETPKNNRLAFTTHEGITILETHQIMYVQSDGNYCEIFYDLNKKLMITKTLKELEELLLSDDFFRIHHSYLINMKHIIKYIKNEGGSVLMSDKKELPVSIRKKQDFLQHLNNTTRH